MLIGVRKINIRRTLILVGIFAIGSSSGYLLGHHLGSTGTKKTAKEILQVTGIPEKVIQPTQNTEVNNKVQLDKKTKGEPTIIMAPNNDQSPNQIITQDSCDYLRDLIKVIKPRIIKKAEKELRETRNRN